MKSKQSCEFRLYHTLDAIWARFRLRASQHPRFRGIGEIGLDYHYTLSPKDVQQTVFKRQLQLALKINEASKDGIAITIHTREAEEDTERILKEVIPKDYGVGFLLASQPSFLTVHM